MGIFLLVWYLGLPGITLLEFYLGFPLWSPAEIVQFAWSMGLYYWILGNIILASKIPVLQGWIPQDQRILVHISTGVIIIAGLLIHTLSKVLGGKVIDLLSWLILGLSIVLLTWSLAWKNAPGLGLIHGLLKKLSPVKKPWWYTLSRRVHGFGFLVLGILQYIHVSRAGVESLGGIFAPFIWKASLVLSLSAWLYGQVHGYFGHGGHIRVISNKAGVTQILIKVKRILRYQPGQFFYLRFPGLPNMNEFHPFSVLSIPQGPRGGDEVWFAVKEQGFFTSNLKNLPSGTKVILQGPFGSLGKKSLRPTIAIGTGIGTVPMISLAMSVGTRPQRTILSVDSRDALPRGPWTNLDQIPWLDIIVKNENYKEIDSKYLLEISKGRPGDFQWLLCSSPTVKSIIIKELRRIGVPKKQIRSEDFSY